MVMNQLGGRLAVRFKLNINFFLFLTGIKRFGDKDFDMFQHSSLTLLSVLFRGDIQLEGLGILPFILKYVSLIFFSKQTEMQNVNKQ